MTATLGRVPRSGKPWFRYGGSLIRTSGEKRVAQGHRLPAVTSVSQDHDTHNGRTVSHLRAVSYASRPGFRIILDQLGVASEQHLEERVADYADRAFLLD
jgi:hypothetical protein